MDIKTVIKEQREELEDIENREKIVEREGQQDALKAIAHPEYKRILGAQCASK